MSSAYRCFHCEVVVPEGAPHTCESSPLTKLSEKIEDAIARFQLHHEFMIGSEVSDER